MPANSKSSNSGKGKSSGQSSSGREGNKSAEGKHSVSPTARKKMSEGGKKGGKK
jgi:hypothetical protein